MAIPIINKSEIYSDETKTTEETPPIELPHSDPFILLSILAKEYTGAFLLHLIHYKNFTEEQAIQYTTNLIVYYDLLFDIE